MTQERAILHNRLVRASVGLVLVLLACVASGTAHAHATAASYLRIDGRDDAGTLAATWDIAAIDLQWTFDLDADGDADITASEIQARRAAITRLATEKLGISRGGVACRIAVRKMVPTTRASEPFVSLQLEGQCSQSGALEVSTSLFFSSPSYTALLDVWTPEGRFSTALSPTRATWLQPPASSLRETLVRFLGEGIWHIWIGFDHIAFLVLLLLPVALRPERNGWRAAEGGRAVMWAAVRIVTAFTLAHSVTLSLAALGIVTPPERPIEMAIAASVAVAGLLNLFPAATRFSVWIAFGFGLIHGFGFANVLGELGLKSGSLVLPLAGFNLGVEAGQLTIVTALLPLLYALRGSMAYRRRVIPATSIAVGMLAVVWLIERAG